MTAPSAVVLEGICTATSAAAAPGWADADR
jgi:hypothetical protein